MARRKRSFIKGRLRSKLVGSLCAGVAFPPPVVAVVGVARSWLSACCAGSDVFRLLALVLSYALFFPSEGVSVRQWRLDPVR